MTTSKYIQDETVSVSSGSVDSVQSKLNPNKVADVLDGLAKKYYHPYSAVVREYVSNGIDSHIKANQSKAVKVTLPSEFNPNLVIQDFGIGMSYEDIVERYANYMMGDKESDVNQIGFFGIGSKSAFAIADQFVITAVKDGLKNIVVAAKNELGTKYDFGVKNQKTDEHDGVIVNIPIREDRISVFHNAYENTYYSIAGWSTDLVEVFGDESDEKFWSKRIPGSKEYEYNDSYYIAVDNNVPYRGGFILGGVYYSRAPFITRLQSNIIPIFDVTDLFPEESREKIRDSSRNEIAFDKKVEEIMASIKEDAIKELTKISGRKERFEELSKYRQFSIGVLEIDGEKFSFGHHIRPIRKWAPYQLNTFEIINQKRCATVFFGASATSRDTVSPEIMENFTSEFDVSSIPSDYVELIEAYNIYKDKEVPVTFSDAKMEELESVSVGKVLNGSKIRLQIANVRKEFNKQARLSVKTDTEKAKIPENTMVHIQEDRYYSNNLLLSKVLKKEDLKPIILMKSKKDLRSSKQFTFIAPSANRATLFEMLKSGLSDKIVACNPTYQEISTLESEAAFETLSEDEKLFTAFVIKAFDAMAKEKGYRRVSDVHRGALDSFFPKKKKNKDNNQRIPASMFEGIEVNLESDAMKKFMKKTSTQLFFYIINDSLSWRGFDSTKEIRDIAKKIVNIMKQN